MNGTEWGDKTSAKWKLTQDLQEPLLCDSHVSCLPGTAARSSWKVALNSRKKLNDYQRTACYLSSLSLFLLLVLFLLLLFSFYSMQPHLKFKWLRVITGGFWFCLFFKVWQLLAAGHLESNQAVHTSNAHVFSTAQPRRPPIYIFKKKKKKSCINKSSMCVEGKKRVLPFCSNRGAGLKIRLRVISTVQTERWWGLFVFSG